MRGSTAAARTSGGDDPRNPAENPEGPEKSPRPPRSQTILLADDDLELAYLLSHKLAGPVREVHTAVSGDTAMELVRLLHLDVAVLDVNMPGMNGPDIVRRIRRSHDLHQPAIVVISAFPDEPARTAALAAGADVVLGKPFSLQDLSRAIDVASRTRG